MNYKLRSIIRFPITFVKEIKYAFQRATRGYSDKDWWSIDAHIANILSKALPQYVKDSPSLSFQYYEGEGDEAFERGLAKRNADYLKYANFFARYYDGGIWQDEKTAQQFNGVTPEECEEAMAWLAKNFSHLWH